MVNALPHLVTASRLLIEKGEELSKLGVTTRYTLHKMVSRGILTEERGCFILVKGVFKSDRRGGLLLFEPDKTVATIQRYRELQKVYGKRSHLIEAQMQLDHFHKRSKKTLDK